MIDHYDYEIEKHYHPENFTTDDESGPFTLLGIHIEYPRERNYMTNIETLERLLDLAKKSPLYKSGWFKISDNIELYVASGDIEKPAKETFFSIRAFGFEVTHQSENSLSVEGKMKNISDFDFFRWSLKIDVEITNTQNNYIVVDGKKYELIPVKEYPEESV